ncbi:MAG: hypothetical protein WCS86_03570 [Candidatus Paceibacterota bacterium]
MEYKNEIKNCQNCKNDFTIEVEDFKFYEKIKVPSPVFCPECRQQRRMTWRNDYNFFPRKCKFCEKRILSIYSEDKPFIVLCPKCWWGDEWDPKEFSQEINFNEPFFTQFRRLMEKVPVLGILNDNEIASINCEYTNYVALSKNCYMVINSWKVEDCMYSICLVRLKDSVDCIASLNGGENLYHSIYVDNSSNSTYVYNSASLLDCAFCFDCRGCNNCFMCFGLRNKNYCFKNKQYSKNEYDEILKEYKLNSWSGMEKAKKEYKEFSLKLPHKYANINNSVNCTGDYLLNSKNSKLCYITVRAENSKYFERGDTVKDSYDCLSGGLQELCYESINPDNSSKALFTAYCHNCTDVFYSNSCQSSENLFGCVGLKKDKYCILNKQYTKDEYETLNLKIIEYMKKTGEWGEFFSSESSPFCYNESVAQDEFPLTKKEVAKKGLLWQEFFTRTEGKETLKEIPDNIESVEDSILGEILVCRLCKRNFKIIKDELSFYKKNSIPIPHECFFCRLAELYKERGPVRFWHRKCMKEGCQNEFETSYAPERPEIVYCESCYQQEVY